MTNIVKGRGIITSKARVHSSKRFNCQKNARIVDVGAGTGVLSRELLRLRPDVTITAIDLSSEMLHYYRTRFQKEIALGKVRVIEGNAEQIHTRVTQKADAVFVACAIWDMEIPLFLERAKKVLKPKGSIVFNLPALVIGISRGFIWFIEQSVREVLPGEELYRRIPRSLLLEECAKQGFACSSEKPYQFKLSKEDVHEFFKVLRYRYPFILFPKDMAYEERLRLCTQIFNAAVKRLTDKGVAEEGTVFVLQQK